LGQESAIFRLLFGRFAARMARSGPKHGRAMSRDPILRMSRDPSEWRPSRKASKGIDVLLQLPL